MGATPRDTPRRKAMPAADDASPSPVPSGAGCAWASFVPTIRQTARRSSSCADCGESDSTRTCSRSAIPNGGKPPCGVPETRSTHQVPSCAARPHRSGGSGAGMAALLIQLQSTHARPGQPFRTVTVLGSALMKPEKQTTHFRGRIISLTTDEVRLPNGHLASLEVVHHPGGAATVAIDAQEHVCLLKQYRYVADGWLWELP